MWHESTAHLRDRPRKIRTIRRAYAKFKDFSAFHKYNVSVAQDYMNVD